MENIDADIGYLAYTIFCGWLSDGLNSEKRDILFHIENWHTLGIYDLKAPCESDEIIYLNTVCLALVCHWSRKLWSEKVDYEKEIQKWHRGKAWCDFFKKEGFVFETCECECERCVLERKIYKEKYDELIDFPDRTTSAKLMTLYKEYQNCKLGKYSDDLAKMGFCKIKTIYDSCDPSQVKIVCEKCVIAPLIKYYEQEIESYEIYENHPEYDTVLDEGEHETNKSELKRLKEDYENLKGTKCSCKTDYIQIASNGKQRLKAMGYEWKETNYGIKINKK